MKLTVDQVLNEIKKNSDLIVKDFTIYRKNPMDASFSGKVGSKTLAKLDFLAKKGFQIVMMEVGEIPSQMDKYSKLTIDSNPKETIKIKHKIKLNKENG